MENIKRNIQLKQKRKKEKEAQKQAELLEKSKQQLQQEIKSEKMRKFSYESQNSASGQYRKSVSLKITDLDTSHSKFVEQDNLESFSSQFKFDTLGNADVSEQFLTAKTLGQRNRDAFGLACQKGDIEAIKQYIQSAKVDIDVVFQDQRNALHLIISSPRMSMKALSFLLDNKININKQNKMGRTPLMLSVLKSNRDICKLLIERKCGIDIQDMYGNTALHYACIYGWNTIAKLLLSSKANIQLKNKNQQVPQQCCSNGQVFKLFNTKSQYTRTVLDQYILKNGRNDHVQKILDKTQQNIPIIEMNIKQQQQESAPIPSKPQNKWRLKLQMLDNFLKQQSELESTIQTITPKASLLDFKCIDLLGKGSFGQVFLAQHQQTKQLYAMKVLNKLQIKQNKLLPYIMMQRKILAMVRHPFIVGLHYAFQTYDKLILIMTYCPGGDLLQLTKKSKRLSQQLVKKYAAEIVLGLQCLHKAQIIYRDLKPANVVLDKDGHACITDFGLAKQSDVGHSFCGSMAYLAPQMLARRGHTRTIDWYLLGVLIYQCYNGKPPFWDTTRDKLILNIKSGIYIPFQASDEMKDIVSKLLISKPQKRLGGTNDAEDVKAHPWFKDINWQDVKARKLDLPKPQMLKLQNKQRKALFIEQDIQKGLIDKIQNWQYCIE